VRAGAVDGLHAFADAAGCGVVNTWGAKGVFVWDDPRHFGTAGLQARDFELAGLGDVDVLVTSGLDDDEVTSRPWEGRAEVIDIDPAELATARPTLPRGTLHRPALYTELAAVCGPLYRQPGSAPARAAALAAALPEGGVVVAEPGLVGFWIARTLPTSVPGSVVVPATGGAAAARRAAAAVAAGGGPVTLVAERELDAPEGVQLEVWPVAEVDLDPTPLIAVAGGIVAWGGV
jgi:thiamine pyrophosphate-dependent acetolactate synthase large subunit-like protein